MGHGGVFGLGRGLGGQPAWMGVQGFLTPLERARTLASQPGPYFFEEIGERTLGALPRDPAGEKSFFSPNPFSLDCCRSSVGFLLAYLACGL